MFSEGSCWLGLVTRVEFALTFFVVLIYSVISSHLVFLALISIATISPHYYFVYSVTKEEEPCWWRDSYENSSHLRLLARSYRARKVLSSHYFVYSVIRERSPARGVW